jgi:threonine dehydrogenase-like Zn-dependent dehydrogenase
MSNLPKTQYAVQLVGPDKLVLNKSKKVFKPGLHQVLAKIEVVGLCFSDLKLLKQFAKHARKSEILSGIDPQVLKEIPSYVPGEAPTVPGHEASVIIEAVGPGVKDFKPGQRYLVQTDYRWLRTAGSNAAFGYNFEGALQEYVLMDERVITSPQGESLLIPASMDLAASALALVEPWACVEDAYASKERRNIKADGQILVVIDSQVDVGVFKAFLSRYGRPRYITWFDKFEISYPSNVPVTITANVSELPDAEYDDVIYFGSKPTTVEKLFSKVALKGLLNIVLCCGKFGRDIETTVGRVHYGGIRIIGTAGCDPAESMEIIPRTGEIRSGDRINIIGAAGPMGLMHVVRNICQGVEYVSIFAGDVDDNRLAFLTKIAAPLADKNGVKYRSYNPQKQKIDQAFDYTVLMAPVPDLVAASVRNAAKHGIINIFAGIPAMVTAKIDLDSYIEKKLYFIGTSGSTLDDMKRMLAKVESGRLDTNVSVAAISGFDGATDGIRAVEDRSIPGKIMVYPACRGLDLVTLKDLDKVLPDVAAELNDGLWTKRAEEKLLAKYRK